MHSGIELLIVGGGCLIRLNLLFVNQIFQLIGSHSSLCFFFKKGSWTISWVWPKNPSEFLLPALPPRSKQGKSATRWWRQMPSLRTGPITENALVFWLQAPMSVPTNCCSHTHSSHSSRSPFCCESLQPAPLSDYTNAQEKSILLFFYTRRSRLLSVGLKYQSFCSYEFAL